MEINTEQKEIQNCCEERRKLAVDRLRSIMSEESVQECYLPYFRSVAVFLLELENVRSMIMSGKWDSLDIEDIKEINRVLYSDILKSNYGQSYANPKYACSDFGINMGRILSLLYAEMRSGTGYVFEENTEYFTILCELFIEVYNCFEQAYTDQGAAPGEKEIRDIIYWYASDYCDVFLDGRIKEQMDPACSFAVDIIENADLNDDRYLYRFGEYITENELGTAALLRNLPDETLRKMADVCTEGFRKGFINTGKDISKKSVVNIRYRIGFEKLIRLVIENFREMGLQPVIYRAASSVVTKKEHHRIGYCGAAANWQYEYDHRYDQALFTDKRYIERRLEVIRTAYEKRRDLARKFAGPAVIETFGEKPFSPEYAEEAFSYNAEQRELVLQYESRSGQIVNEYIPGDERSFMLVAYPVPEIGEKYEEIFREVIRINTLDAEVYTKVQQAMIDALDQGEYVQIKGGCGNRTDLKVKLCSLNDPSCETKFENCVADVNIPVGEVFTSPVLEGTKGVLHVSSVYLEGLEYKDLELHFEEGMVTDYSCGNFDSEEEGEKYVYENILKNHKTLPLGEFAVGTNTTAYVAAKKYGIGDKLPILIAEKTGPHFAVGDTCYSWCEEIRVYNPNGKEIMAKDNSVSLNRKTDPAKAYFHCHTDITIPYEELEEISVVTKDGKHIILIKGGKFVLPGTEVLNEPLKEL